MHIIFFCPPTTVVNGGIKYIFRMAEALIAQEHDAVVLEQNGKRPDWFASTAPVVGQGDIDPGSAKNADQIYVLPEDQPHILNQFKNFPQKKVIYSQNHFYAALGIEGVASYADYGISHILCSSRTIYDHAKLRHPHVQAHLVPCSVDPTLFKPAQKKNAIAFMPRKRRIEATYIRDMFRFAYPQYRDWEWVELLDNSESEIAAALGEEKIFLSLSRLEGFGLTPLEAMASGCVVAGFTGLGGREYATDQNGFWADEDDFPMCVTQLQKAVELSLDTGKAKSDYAEACQKTLQNYTPEVFADAVKKSWQSILGD